LDAYPGYSNGHGNGVQNGSLRAQLLSSLKETDKPSVGKIIEYDIQSGDTLSTIFDRLDLGQTAMYQILSADESLLALDVMRPGQRLTFTLNPETSSLQEMELRIHAGNRVAYRRADDGVFEYEEQIIKGDWPVRVLASEIHGSFYISAQNMGLTQREIAEVTRLFEEQFDFARDIRAGDVVEIVRSEQMINGRPTGQTRIEAIHFNRYNRTNTAYLFDDGSYYDENGDSLARAFMRYPMSNRMRISSAFNPSRRHPVTGRVSPHNGTDFAMRTGSSVLSTGDGVVTRVENHPYAGKYVEIQHGNRYATRYLHLDKILVRHGQSIARGDRVGLSGATGRVTGPHLHFELHVNGRPVNPMTAN
ncbi:MAG: peptidoglycan DD-metalloendopeptidase family protein, partial [Natronospirillum sp.]